MTSASCGAEPAIVKRSPERFGANDVIALASEDKGLTSQPTPRWVIKASAAATAPVESEHRQCQSAFPALDAGYIERQYVAAIGRRAHQRNVQPVRRPNFVVNAGRETCKLRRKRGAMRAVKFQRLRSGEPIARLSDPPRVEMRELTLEQ